MRFLITSLITLVGTIIPTFADECADVCTMIRGSCSHKGSYCKNGHACMDLFWSLENREICNHSIAGCENKKEVSCTDAARIVETRNSAGVTVLGSTSSARAADVATSPPAAPRWSGSGMKRMSSFPGTAEIQSSLLGSYAQVLAHSRSFKKALEGPHHLAPYSSFAQSVWDTTCRYLDVLYDDRNTSSIVDSRRFMQKLYWDRWMWHAHTNSERFQQYIASFESITDWHDDLEKVLGPNHLKGSVHAPLGPDRSFFMFDLTGDNFERALRAAFTRKVGSIIHINRPAEMMILFASNFNSRAPILFTIESFGSITYARGQALGTWYGLVGVIRRGNGNNRYKAEYFDHAEITWVSVDGDSIGRMSGEPDRWGQGVYAYIYDRMTSTETMI